MPELPEVQTVVNTLAPRIVGCRIERAELFRADFAHPAECDLCRHLLGRTARNVHRRGKRIVFTLDDGNRFYIHLGMSGRLTMDRPDAELLTHTHFIVHFEGFQMRLRDPRRFGGVFWLGASPTADDMGPEPLAVRPQQLAGRLARTHRAIKNALLDQTLIAGLGNIYVDESLFEAGVHPLAFADALSEEQVRRLTRAIKLTLRRALRHRGSTLRDYVDANGNGGGFQRLHQVYDRAGDVCPRCRKSAIRRIVLGGRSTHFCPKCQLRR